MSNNYETKQIYREKRKNSSVPQHEEGNRKSGVKGNKRRGLVAEARDDFHPDQPRMSVDQGLIPVLYPSFSTTSDTGVDMDEDHQRWVRENGEIAFGATTELPGRVAWTQWNPDDYPLQTTALRNRFYNWYEIQYRCRRAQPKLDETIYADLARTLPPVLLSQFFTRVYPASKYRFSRSLRHPELADQANDDLERLGFSERQTNYIKSVCQTILYRSSYGILFIKNGKFLSYRINNGGAQRTTVKGYSELNSIGEWESPWETAVRLTKNKLFYSTTEPCEWQQLDLDALVGDHRQVPFLECLVAGFSANVHDRYIGLFIIRLNENMEIQPLTPFDILEWHPISGGYGEEFYTLTPFIRYLNEHRELL